MNHIEEIKRLASPAPRPQSLAWHNGTLWMGSMESETIYQIDPEMWTVIWEIKAPGVPFGMVSIGEELRVLCGETEEDNRIIRRCIPGHGFDTVFKLPCPNDTGSQLGFDGSSLYVSQWYNKVILQLGIDDKAHKSLSSPHGICGQVFVDKSIYLSSTNSEETNNYFLTQISLSSETATDIAKIPFGARALAFDGQCLWTNDRENHKIVCFKRPV